MTYRLAFKESAKKEWDKLDGSVREQFKKKLRERLELPRVAAAALSGMPDCYKIKLRSVGYRLIYEVSDSTITVTVIAVGRRDSIYQT
ncbi:type II toxin-antitoxin system RelE/ParE family toxin [Chitiniphilus eburneus]|uniref:type II toxin-antitoxin system RelE family toxin n=1 Tax=Chitiniphilus eburneus TaxID=2571148 RepID=UPI0035D0FC37